VADIQSGREQGKKRPVFRRYSHCTQIKKAGNYEKIDMEDGQPCKDFANDASQHFVARAFLHGKAIPLVRKQTLQESPIQGRDPI
jgi:hypothetical protein